MHARESGAVFESCPHYSNGRAEQRLLGIRGLAVPQQSDWQARRQLLQLPLSLWQRLLRDTCAVEVGWRGRRLKTSADMALFAVAWNGETGLYAPKDYRKSAVIDESSGGRLASKREHFEGPSFTRGGGLSLCQLQGGEA